jgi:hypothetical protein
MDQPLKEVDLLRHELKALRFLLETRGRALAVEDFPPREDFQSPQGRALYDAITGAPDAAAARARIARLELEDVDIDSFLRLDGSHYYSYPALVKQRAAAIRAGTLKVEPA